LALSELKSCPTAEIWTRAKSMEATRKQRLAEIPNRQQTS